MNKNVTQNTLTIIQEKIEIIMRRIFKTKLRRFAGNLQVVVFIAALGSCTYYTNDFDPLDVPDNVSFETDIIPIFEASCNTSGCHSGAVPPDLRADVAYKSLISGGYVTDITAAENNILYQVIDGGSMQVYATDLERAYIKKWIEEGALNN